MSKRSNLREMTALNNALAEKYLKSYRWSELWEVLKPLMPEVRHGSQPWLALKAMLLAGWWQDGEQAKECMAIYPDRITAPLTHFALCYTALCLGDLPRFIALRRHTPRTQPAWMRHWLELEQLGRARKTLDQIKKVRLITPAGKPPPEYACVALLQSNESVSLDTAPIQEWLNGLDERFRTHPLLRALSARCGQGDAFKMDGEIIPLSSMPPPLLYRYALYLFAQRRLVDALGAFDSLAQTGFVDLSTLLAWLELSSSIPQGYRSIPERTQFAINFAPHSLVIQGTVAAYALIAAWIRGDAIRAEAIVERFYDFIELPKTSLIKNIQVFFFYVARLSSFKKKNFSDYAPVNTEPVSPLVALGESHSLALSNIVFSMQGQQVKAVTAFVMGVKMHHLAQLGSSHLAECLRLHINALKKKPIHLLLTIGEIDTRPDEGMWPLHRNKGVVLQELIAATIDGYLAFLAETLQGNQFASITIQGIPAPGYALEGDKDPGDVIGFVEMIRLVNERLRAKVLQAGYRFLDVYGATVGEDGRSNGRWHLDGYHLSPAFYKEADEWLVIPSEIERMN